MIAETHTLPGISALSADNFEHGGHDISISLAVPACAAGTAAPAKSARFRWARRLLEQYACNSVARGFILGCRFS